MKRAPLTALLAGFFAANLTYASQDVEVISSVLPLFATPTTLDRIGRVVAPVMVNGRGPFRLVVDTGANRSTISSELAEKLGLDYASAPKVLLNGVTGSAPVPAVNIERVEAGDLLLENQRMPVVSTQIMGGADGILGIASLRDERILIDFERDLVQISRSRAGLTADFLRIKAERIEPGLLVAKIRIGRTKALAVIDTGAEVTLGNLALMRALRAGQRKEQRDAATTVYGATHDTHVGQRHPVPRITIGSVVIRDVRVTFGDFHIFEVWEMLDEPVLLLGMDVLGTVDTLVIDFRRSEIHIRS